MCQDTHFGSLLTTRLAFCRILSRVLSVQLNALRFRISNLVVLLEISGVIVLSCD